MTEHTYTLKSITPVDIGGIIGKNGSGLKKIISESWKMYEIYKTNDKSITEEKPTLVIRLSDNDETVSATIRSSSEMMIKFAKKRLDENIVKFHTRKSLQAHSFYIDFPHCQIGRLLGKKASNLKRILNNCIYDKDGGISIDNKDVNTAKSARLRVKELSFETTGALLEHIKSKRNSCFIGWPPESTDPYEEHISVTVSFSPQASPFEDLDLYIDKFRDEVTAAIESIKKIHRKDLQEIDECVNMSFD